MSGRIAIIGFGRRAWRFCAAALHYPALAGLAGRVSDWEKGAKAALDKSVAVLVISGAIDERFGSRGEAQFAGKEMVALRCEFGGLEQRAAAGKGGV